MYIGPEIMMPLASAFAAITGVIIMFWHKIVAVFRAGLQMITGRGGSRE